MKLMSLGTAPLGSPAFFLPFTAAQKNAVDDLVSSAAKLASGNRILNISEDVASFSLATRLQSQITGLRQSAQNISQGVSLLQVASGGLQQIKNNLLELKTVAIQADSGALTSIDRGYLQQRFTSLLDSIDNVASITRFGSLGLLDGTLAGGKELTTLTTGSAKANGTLTFNASTTNGQFISINNVVFEVGQTYNGVTLTAGTASVSATNLAAVLNASTDPAITQASYSANGAVLTITSRAGGRLGNSFIISDGQSTANVTASGAVGFVTGGSPPVTLTGGSDSGLGIGNTGVSGDIGENVITAQSQTAANRTLTITGTINPGDTITFSGANSSTVFTFAASPANQFQIAVGATREETLQNIVKTFETFKTSTSTTGADGNDTRYDISQLDFSISGDVLTVSNARSGNPEALQINGGSATLSVAATGNISVSGAALNNGTRTGVDVSNVVNGSFVGTVSGFSAVYNSADNVTASITVGNITYSATISDTTPGSDTSVTFKSTEGGSFDVLLRGGSGSAVGAQPAADDYAQRLDDAFSTLTFTQARKVSTFVPTGNLVGSSVRAQVTSPATLRLDDISVTAPGSGADATVNITINGASYRSSAGIGKSIGAYETVKFTNVNDSKQFISFTNGAVVQDLSTTDSAESFEQALISSFSLNTPARGTDFRIGNEATDVINVSIPNSNSTALFGGVSYNVLTQDAADEAQTAITAAENTIQTLISYTGGKISAFETAGRNVQQALTGIQAANAALADTDIIEESTKFATAQVRVNASTAVIAQVLSLPQGLINNLSALGNR